MFDLEQAYLAYVIIYVPRRSVLRWQKLSLPSLLHGDVCAFVNGQGLRQSDDATVVLELQPSICAPQRAHGSVTPK